MYGVWEESKKLTDWVVAKNLSYNAKQKRIRGKSRSSF